MRVFIDDGMATRLTSGIGSHTFELHRRLADKTGAGSSISAVGFAGHTLLRKLGRRESRLLYHLNLQTVAPATFPLRCYDIVHFANFFSPSWRLPGPRFVVTVHDLSMWDMPDLLNAPMWYWRYSRWAFVRAMRVSDGVIVRTESTRRRLRQQFGVPGGKTFVCPDGVKDVYIGPCRPVAEREQVLLFVGILTGRKNPGTALRAFLKLAPRFPGLRLVFVGNRWIGWEAAEREIQQSPFRDRIEIRQGLSDLELRQLYDRAAILLVPSLYEGFGIPIIEGLARGLPVVASDIEVFREVGGEAATYYGKPEDADALARTIADLLQDAPRRARMAEDGLKRSEMFRWDRIARRYVEIYEAILEAK